MKINSNQQPQGGPMSFKDKRNALKYVMCVALEKAKELQIKMNVVSDYLDQFSEEETVLLEQDMEICKIANEMTKTIDGD